MRDNLPKKIRRNESGILNIDSKLGVGTHWTAYVKENKYITYFDSYGNLPPPSEVVKYFFSSGPVDISYNYNKYQKDSYKCGHYSLDFLYKYYTPSSLGYL